MEDVISLAHHFFPPKSDDNYYRGIITSPPAAPWKELLDAVKIPVHEVCWPSIASLVWFSEIRKVLAKTAARAKEHDFHEY
jgi:hypothetical protein